MGDASWGEFSALFICVCTWRSRAASVRNFLLHPLNIQRKGFVSMWSITCLSSQLKLHDDFLNTEQPFHMHLNVLRHFWLNICFDLMCSIRESSTSVELPSYLHFIHKHFTLLFVGRRGGSIIHISFSSLLLLLVVVLLLLLFETEVAQEEILREVAVDRVILAMPDVEAELLLVAALLRLELHI